MIAWGKMSKICSALYSEARICSSCRSVLCLETTLMSHFVIDILGICHCPQKTLKL